ncbi:MAG: hypothetical protein PVI91_06480 [Gammaproteobacteria bacterium]|jgi:predicted  nucleic acid-binding Zn-ribbon protein
MTDTGDYVARMQARLDEWNDRIEKLEAALVHQQATGRVGTDELLILVNNLRRQQSAVREAIQAMRAARDQHRQQLEDEISLKMDDMRDTLDKATGLLRPD